MESGEQVSSNKREKKSVSVTGHIGIHPKHTEDIHGGTKIGILFSSGKISSFTTRK